MILYSHVLFGQLNFSSFISSLVNYIKEMLLEENNLARSYLAHLMQILSYSSHVNTEVEHSIVSTVHFILFHFFFICITLYLDDAKILCYSQFKNDSKLNCGNPQRPLDVPQQLCLVPSWSRIYSDFPWFHCLFRFHWHTRTSTHGDRKILDCHPTSVHHDNQIDCDDDEQYSEKDDDSKKTSKLQWK